MPTPPANPRRHAGSPQDALQLVRPPVILEPQDVVVLEAHLSAAVGDGHPVYVLVRIPTDVLHELREGGHGPTALPRKVLEPDLPCRDLAEVAGDNPIPRVPYHYDRGLSAERLPTSAVRQQRPDA
eukprot:CAMPEP_0179181730 /NCGR_PEP_ID=MMETSP0796-20121207/90017_1 /TAXON_ID=73915 /ORGANISM="Pyrodinium bahamense, Strain pbaha01" /LENGTH=125 /DNA_ID=CAMNT_0020885523 /DNA_START=107 /DNA_END=480 /DNA_ORIENTATION=-